MIKSYIHHINEFYTPNYLYRIWNHTLNYCMAYHLHLRFEYRRAEPQERCFAWLWSYGWGSQLKAYKWLSLNHIGLFFLVMFSICLFYTMVNYHFSLPFGSICLFGTFSNHQKNKQIEVIRLQFSKSFWIDWTKKRSVQCFSSLITVQV